MPRKNSPPPTPTSPGSAPGSELSESDFVILPRPSMENANNMAGNQQADLQLQSQFSPVSNGSSIMQIDQLLNAARSMKEENSLLRGQLTEMVQTMEARTEEFVYIKTCNRQVTERCKEIREKANLEITRLRDHVKTLEEQLKQGSYNQEDRSDELLASNKTLTEKLSSCEVRIQQLEMELKDKTEEVVVSFGRDTETPVSLLTQLRRDIVDVQGTRADIRSTIDDLEAAFNDSAAKLKHSIQRADQLRLEKQDLVALNNELQTKISSGRYSEDSLFSQTVGTEKSDPSASGFAGDESGAITPPFSPGQAMQKSSVALQDVLVQLQAERDKVGSLMDDLKKEREGKNKIETTLMEQLHVRSGEHDTALKELRTKHDNQVEELVRKLDELTVANQEPHHSMELKQQVRSLVCELQECENTLQQKEHTVADLHALNAALKSKISLYHDELEGVRKQDSHMIETLREEFQRQQVMHQMDKQKAVMERMNHEKLSEEYNQLFADFDELNRKYEDLRTRSGQAVNATALRELAEQRDNLTAQVMSAEEAIGAKEAELQKALTDLRTATAKLETVPVLEAQAEIFKIDFDAERAAREKAHSEREALMLELEMLKEDNQRMQEELAGHSQAQLQQMQHRHGSTSGAYSSSGPLPSSTGLYERYITPLFGSGKSGGRNYGQKYNQGVGNDDTYQIIPEGGFGVDVDQLAQGGADEAGTGAISPGIAGQNEKPANPSCPKCQEEFPDIDTLQIHMLECIR